LDGGFEEAFALCSSCPEGAGQPLPERPEVRNDLWHHQKAFDHGAEGNLAQWEHAVEMLDSLVEFRFFHDKDALMVALMDARDRAREEVRRAASEVRMRREWAASQPTGADLL
jgi:hypothetical protein